jgi:hypothetical protein
MDLHGLAEERSLAYHRRVAELLPSRPELIDEARRRARRWAASGSRSAPWAREWERVLEGTPEEIARQLTDSSEHASALRQSTPFAGALDPRERWLLWRQVRDRWESR